MNPLGIAPLLRLAAAAALSGAMLSASWAWAGEARSDHTIGIANANGGTQKTYSLKVFSKANASENGGPSFSKTTLDGTVTNTVPAPALGAADSKITFKDGTEYSPCLGVVGLSKPTTQTQQFNHQVRGETGDASSDENNYAMGEAEFVSGAGGASPKVSTSCTRRIPLGNVPVTKSAAEAIDPINLPGGTYSYSVPLDSIMLRADLDNEVVRTRIFATSSARPASLWDLELSVQGIAHSATDLHIQLSVDLPSFSGMSRTPSAAVDSLRAHIVFNSSNHTFTLPASYVLFTAQYGTVSTTYSEGTTTAIYDPTALPGSTTASRMVAAMLLLLSGSWAVLRGKKAEA